MKTIHSNLPFDPQPDERLSDYLLAPISVGPADDPFEFCVGEVADPLTAAHALARFSHLNRNQRRFLKQAMDQARHVEPLLRFLSRFFRLSDAAAAWNRVSDWPIPDLPLSEADLARVTLGELSEIIERTVVIVAGHRRKLEIMRHPKTDHLFERVTVMHDGKADCAYRAECRCGETQDMTPSSIEILKKRLSVLGWSIRGNKTTCPSCNGTLPMPSPKTPALTVVPPIVQPAADLPRNMTPSDKRRVFREIDDNWNEGRARYAGSATDQTIATKLDVPRAWVEAVRTEAFGANRNEDMDKLIGTLKNLKGQVERAGEQALELASKFETLGREVKELESKIADLA